MFLSSVKKINKLICEGMPNIYLKVSMSITNVLKTSIFSSPGFWKLQLTQM